MSGKNRLFKSGKTVRLRWDFCRSRISAGFGKSAVTTFFISGFLTYLGLLD